VPESRESSRKKSFVLKDPALSALLAWLIPGLGHWYQGGAPKAVLYFLCIMGHVCPGVYLGGNRQVGLDGPSTSRGATTTTVWRISANRHRYTGFGRRWCKPIAWPTMRRFRHGFMAPPRSSTSSSLDGRETRNAGTSPRSASSPQAAPVLLSWERPFTMIGGLVEYLADLRLPRAARSRSGLRKRKEASSDTRTRPREVLTAANLRNPTMIGFSTWQTGRHSLAEQRSVVTPAMILLRSAWFVRRHAHNGWRAILLHAGHTAVWFLALWRSCLCCWCSSRGIRDASGHGDHLRRPGASLGYRESLLSLRPCANDAPIACFLERRL